MIRSHAVERFAATLRQLAGGNYPFSMAFQGDPADDGVVVARARVTLDPSDIGAIQLLLSQDACWADCAVEALLAGQVEECAELFQSLPWDVQRTLTDCNGPLPHSGMRIEDGELQFGFSAALIVRAIGR